MKKLIFLACFIIMAMAINAANAGETIVRDEIKKAFSDAPAAELHLGRYELYSGVPTMYLGHFILLPNGKYKVAFDTDETNYDESGRYSYNKETGVITWISGMFKNNNWAGKTSKGEKGGYRIQFNKVTYGDSK